MKKFIAGFWVGFGTCVWWFLADEMPKAKKVAALTVIPVWPFLFVAALFGWEKERQELRRLKEKWHAE